MPAFLPVVARFMSAAGRVFFTQARAYGSRRAWFAAKAKEDARWAKMRRGKHGGYMVPMPRMPSPNEKVLRSFTINWDVNVMYMNKGRMKRKLEALERSIFGIAGAYTRKTAIQMLGRKKKPVGIKQIMEVYKKGKGLKKSARQMRAGRFRAIAKRIKNQTSKPGKKPSTLHTYGLKKIIFVVRKKQKEVIIGPMRFGKKSAKVPIVLARGGRITLKRAVNIRGLETYQPRSYRRGDARRRHERLIYHNYQKTYTKRPFMVEAFRRNVPKIVRMFREELKRMNWQKGNRPQRWRTGAKRYRPMANNLVVWHPKSSSTSFSNTQPYVPVQVPDKIPPRK